uniref:P-type ATPase C-terminal domain-containing protein n=1 Tax=Chromera velia CCMP2878 TaxID=1169474 RepID=A0A0G4HSW5_9ALVE|eukprot:Cvel_8341.t1-p1 / transcript=Cvel_8341.t1 / gene=Cvel_8341 / organism=Chromera_velia_CCMP2878 / gene_product=Probable phospholipid-transporting ATPase ID, putative / transcript_product=Probable phospholipid-transporting ATPase ID, putative / location=Cvel_scaffold459:26096-42480(-) / protein_length=749 / sequence_SO=supercontig / SO=protein_coding / is_pseudo=false
MSNFVRTYKYTWYDFVPIPAISALNPSSAWLPLIFVLGVSMVREGNEDLVGLQMATEQPRGSLEEFDASIEVKGQRSPVEVDNFLPRESILRNCHFVVGCAVFTGHETRVMKGKLNFKPKRSAVDILINKLVLALIVFQVMLSLTCAVCKYLWDISNAEIWYLDPGRERAVVASVYGEGSVNFHGSQGLTPKSRRRSLLMECDTTKFDPRLIDDLVKAEPLHEELCVQMQAGFSIEDQGTLNNEFLLALALCQEVTPEYEEKMLIYTAAVDAYSRLGLRTLAIAMKVITPEFWADWKARATEASCLMDKTEKEARLLELYKEVELDCLILGATGTEDKIQDGVPECIARMRQAKIAVWMITGDKLDTATEIAKSCRLIDSKEMRIDVCDEKKDVETGKKIISFGQEGGRQKYAIIISGVSLDHVFSNPQLTEHFYKYSVKSVSDGANDVPMLKEAHVGVGIFGKEGTQAVQNSDVAIAQFRFLEKLLLYHGRYFFYKNVCFTMAQFYFALAAAWSGQTFFEDWYIASFNVLFTNLPVFAIGLMEYDARPELSETVRRNLPLLYSVGQLNLHFNRSALLRVWVQAYIHSVIIYMVAHFSVGPLVAGAGLVSNFWLSSHTAFGAVIIVVNVKIFTLMRSWTDLMVYSVLVSIFLYFFFFIVYDFIPFNKSYRTSLNAASTGVFWLAIIVSIVLCNLTDLGWQAYIRWFRPEQEDAAIEVQVVAQRDQRLMEKKGLIKKERGEDFGVREDER